MRDEKPVSLVIRARVREIAKAKGKVLSTAFLDLLDREVASLIEQGCHFIGDKKIVKADEFEAHRNLLRRYSK